MNKKRFKYVLRYDLVLQVSKGYENCLGLADRRFKLGKVYSTE